MWSSVAPDDIQNAAPSARSKHSATVVGDHVYLLGGRNGNLPTRDFWKYNLVTGKWQQLKPAGDKLPCLQEHTSVAYKDILYVFGGEVGFSAGTETPLWTYDIKGNIWKKIRTKKGVVSPKGRRGHTALIHKGNMLIYGGYQDLRGSSSELWTYHFETESWHLLNVCSNKNDSSQPPPRHKHSAVLHGDAMWIYGGMTDLQERSDLWKWDIRSKKWTNYKSKINPGLLHSHAACKMPSCMIIFGGERNGQTCNDLWKFSFTTETWDKITISGLKPQPRAESVAFTVSELLLKDPSSLNSKALQIRRSCNSVRHSSYLPNNKVAPCEQTYVFEASEINYTDGSNNGNDLAQQYAENNRASRGGFLQEISKLSQINITRMSNKCSYSVLTGVSTDSTESLLRQHSSSSNEKIMETGFSTPSRMVKSKSAYVIKKKYQDDDGIQKYQDDQGIKEVAAKKKVEFETSNSTIIKRMPREPISVPNFSVLTLPTPVLNPVEATKLVYLTDEDNDYENEADTVCNNKKRSENEFNLNLSLKKDASYSSHLAYADNPLYQEMISSLQEHSQENVSSTSDYASIETMNRLSSASNYSMKMTSNQLAKENVKNSCDKDKEGPFGFCNPNYMGPDIKSILADDNKPEKAFKKATVLKFKEKNDKEDVLEMQEINGVINGNTTVLFRNNSNRNRPPKSLALDDSNCRQKPPKIDKCRALSASRAERNPNKNVQESNSIRTGFQENEPYVPFYIYVIGGKEQGQVTVFQRPISIWKLKLF